MLTVDFIDILEGWAGLAGVDPAEVPAVEFGNVRGYVSRRLATAWEFDDWPEIRRCEKRYFRPVYSGSTTYSAGVEVYYPATGKYYQTLATILNITPADALGNTRVQNWAECQTTRSAADYDAARAYVAGDQVFYPTTDLFYQAYTSTTGNAPTDTTKWCAIAEFDRYIRYLQQGFTEFSEAGVVRVTNYNPRTRRDAREQPWFLSETGVQVTVDVPYVWVDFKLVCPRLTGAVFSAAATYAVGQQVYYSSDAFRGNFYTCVEVTAAGESPENSVRWEIVLIPRRFEGYLIQGAYADWLPGDGQNEKKRGEAMEAMGLLAAEQMTLNAQGGRSEMAR